MLALDPPLGAAALRRSGGSSRPVTPDLFATATAAPRDLVIGITVALSDGTVAKSGGKVIKNVAGYDLGKLFAGSFGTLGLILGVAVRLHPRPATPATALFRSDSPDALARTAAALAHAPLELEALDVRWERGRGAVLARAAGAAALQRAGNMVERWGGEVVEADDALWAAQRDSQRSDDGIVLSRLGLAGAARPAARGGRARGSPARRAGGARSCLGDASGRLCAGRVRREFGGSSSTVLPVPSSRPWDAQNRRRRAHAPRQGAVRPGRHPEPGRLRRRHLDVDAGFRCASSPGVGLDRDLRPLRLLPADLPHVYATLERGDGLAARAHRPHAGRAGRRQRPLGRDGEALRPLPRAAWPA